MCRLAVPRQTESRSPRSCGGYYPRAYPYPYPHQGYGFSGFCKYYNNKIIYIKEIKIPSKYALVFEGEGGGGMWQRATMEQPPSKMSIHGEVATALENEPHMLGFEGGNGGGVAKEQPPSKTSRVWSVSKVEMVVVLPRSDHPRKRAYVARFRG
jgi:hypothetical protein